jgi:hypothetical protein
MLRRDSTKARLPLINRWNRGSLQYNYRCLKLAKSERSGPKAFRIQPGSDERMQPTTQVVGGGNTKGKKPRMGRKKIQARSYSVIVEQSYRG